MVEHCERVVGRRILWTVSSDRLHPLGYALPHCPGGNTRPARGIIQSLSLSPDEHPAAYVKRAARLAVGEKDHRASLAGVCGSVAVGGPSTAGRAGGVDNRVERYSGRMLLHSDDSRVFGIR